MHGFNAVEIKGAEGDTKAALDKTAKAFGGVPNIMKMLANAPKLLEAIVDLNSAACSGDITPKMVEQIAITTSGRNNCDYCVATHMYVGQKFGLTDAELTKNIYGNTDDPKVAPLLNFAKQLVDKRGQIDKTIIDEVRMAGYDDKAILDVLGVVGVYTFLNYLNHLTKPELDFPAVEFERVGT